MIGRLTGVLALKQAPQILIDVNGVGYEVDVPMSTFFNLPALDQPVTLLTHFVVREDAQVLYGFGSSAERQLFRLLLKVSGVGAKLALSVLSGMSVSGFIQCVEQKDVGMLCKIPGVGKKTAERLVVEMADRVKLVGNSPSVAHSGQIDMAATSPDNPQGEADTALVALGYKPAEINRMLKGVDTSELSAEDIIRAALQGALK
ncbi:MAG: Holliday junction DNA helicase RuvA [Pseudoalteromonas tetraodonis]|jgi:Holliday junction DNA helicase RuvA